MPRLTSALLLSWLAVMPPIAFAAEGGAAVLMYHRFGEDRYPSTNVRIGQFEEQLQLFENEGFSVWSLGRVLAAVFDNGEPLPPKVVAITIDDAYASIYDNAFPLLKKRGWPFHVFVSTDPVDRRMGDFLTWDQMREMQKFGATFSNHTTTHDHLLERRNDETEAQWLARVRADIQAAEARLGAELGVTPKLFAYPYGEYDRRLMTLLAEMGYHAFGQHSGALGKYSHPQALPRFPVNETYGQMPGFGDKVRSLPFTLAKIPDFDPLTTNPKPVLHLDLDEEHARLDRLSCFVSGQGKVEVTWTDRAAGQFEVVAPQPLAPGRNRYNCTAPSDQSGRYFWFSQPWIVLAPEEAAAQ